MVDRRRGCAKAGAKSTVSHPLLTAATVLGAYLLGSIPFGVFLARRVGVDVRASGSGNIGATNVARTAGARLGLVALAADVMKGTAPVLVASYLDLDHAARGATALAAVIGHLYPVFGGFSGGKGVATTLGVLLPLAPDVALAAVAVFAVVLGVTRIVSAASVSAAVVLPFAAHSAGHSGILVAVTGVLALLIVWRHRDNLARLRAGKEPRLGERSR